MYGQMSICQICMFQDRREDNGRETGCLASGLEIDYDACDGFEILEGPYLGARLAELYNLVDLAWSVIVAVLADLEGGGDIVLQDRDVKADRPVFGSRRSACGQDRLL